MVELFPELDREKIKNVTASIDQQTWQVANAIVESVRTGGEKAVRNYAKQLDHLPMDQPLLIPRKKLLDSLNSLEFTTRELLERTADRIRRFAKAQRASFLDCQLAIPGGSAGHRWTALKSAGCYAPGGRYPLPSSVLMTATTARVAGVQDVYVASPNPSEVTLAAAAIAGADAVLQVGGAQAIAALAFGIDDVLNGCEVIVGPGNRFVTAAKALVSKFTRIDMLAGPSELVVVAGGDANPEFIAADLLAQAEHDPDARPILIANDRKLVSLVINQIKLQLKDLPTADVARAALSSSGYLVVSSLNEAVDCCRVISPEHLSLQGEEFERNSERFDMGAALFVGSASAEVFGDYGAGPNHVLPTSGAARTHSALSVETFMRFQTVLQIDDLAAASQLTADAVSLGRIEGLEAHSRSAERRRSGFEGQSSLSRSQNQFSKN